MSYSTRRSPSPILFFFILFTTAPLAVHAVDDPGSDQSLNSMEGVLDSQFDQTNSKIDRVLDQPPLETAAAGPMCDWGAVQAALTKCRNALNSVKLICKDKGPAVEQGQSVPDAIELTKASQQADAAVASSCASQAEVAVKPAAPRQIW